MGRHKKKDPDIELKSVKQGLASIIKPAYRSDMIEYISEMSIRGTKIAALASLLFLMLVSIEKNEQYRVSSIQICFREFIAFCVFCL